MAYDEKKLTRLGALKDLAQRLEKDYATKAALKEVSDRVEEIATVGGEPNVITTVKVNGAAQPVTDKAVNITVPTNEDIAAAVAAADHLQRKKVASVDDIDPAAQGADKFIYMVPKADAESGDQYDEYMVLDGKVEKVGDWAVDLSGYVPKEEGKGLSANDFTDEEKAKLAGLEIATDEEVKEMLDEVFGPAA